MNYLLAGIIVFSQLFIIPQVSFRWAKELSLQIFIISSLVIMIWKRNRWFSGFILWSLFLFLATKSYLVNDCMEKPFFLINILSLLNMINIVLFGILYYTLHNLKLNKELIYKSFCLIAFLESAYVIIQSLQLDQFFYSISMATTEGKPKVCWPVGTWANESLVAWCIAICSPFFLYFKKLRYKIGFLISLVAILLTKTSGGLAAFISSFLLFSLFKNWKIGIIVLLLAIIAISYGVITDKVSYYLQDTHRFKVWEKALIIWKQAPITGHGLGSFRQTFYLKAPEFAKDGKWAQAHNDYVQLLYEYGIIGFLMIMGMIVTRIYVSIRNRKGLIPLLSIISYLVCAFFGFPTYTAMGGLLIISLVLLEKELWQDAQM